MLLTVWRAGRYISLSVRLETFVLTIQWASKVLVIGRKANIPRSTHVAVQYQWYNMSKIMQKKMFVFSEWHWYNVSPTNKLRRTVEPHATKWSTPIFLSCRNEISLCCLHLGHTASSHSLVLDHSTDGYITSMGGLPSSLFIVSQLIRFLNLAGRHHPLNFSHVSGLAAAHGT